MPWGARLDGSAADRAVLLAIVQRSAKAFAADWLVLDGSGDGGGGSDGDGDGDSSYVVTDALDQKAALALAKEGHDVVQVAPAAAGGLEVVRLRSGATLPVAGLRTRRAAGLLAALAPRPRAENGVPVEAVFVVDSAGESARLLERLLLLGRHDARTCDVVVDGAPRLLVRVAAPPVWLLLWCGDEPSRGVRAYVRHSDGGVDEGSGVFTEFGFRHPLADKLGEALSARGEVGLLDGSGRLRRTKAPWPEVTLHDALAPTLPATTTTLQPMPLTRKFEVRLRLGAALDDDNHEPELFVLDDDDDLFLLESFVEGADAAELARLLLSRVSSADGRGHTVVREVVRPGMPRLGARLSTLLNRPGYVRVAGFDGLYLPPGKRLVPQLRRDDLRALLSLEDAAAVVVEEDSDGLRVTRLPRLDDEPMSKLVTFLATSRRVELDRMLEEAVLTFPGLALDRPKPVVTERAPRPVEAKPVEAAKRPPKKLSIRPAEAAEAKAVDNLDVAALQERERALEDVAFGGDGDGDGDGHDASADAGVWSELAAIKLALANADDAAVVAGTALFLEPSAATAHTLVKASEVQKELSDIVMLCTVDRPSHAQAQRLAGLVLIAVQQKNVDEGVLQQAEKVLSSPDVPLPRRLQWAALRALHQRQGDPIGMTRAKEAVVGALNVRGLTEALDLPRFVRNRLALDDAGGGRGARVQARGEQLVVVERLLPRVVPQPLELSERREALLKAIFLNGLARLGGEVKDLSRALEHELPAHDGPVRILLRLYIARAAFAVTSDHSPAALEAWRDEVKRALASAEKVEDRRVAEWLIKRSLWLRTDPVADPPLALRPALEKIVSATVKGERTDVVDSIRAVTAHTGSYDFEIAAALERLLEAALNSGRDDVIEASAEAAWKAAPTLRILAHRARLLGAVVKAAATAGAANVVERALDDVAAIAADRNVPSTRDLLTAVRPALFALRRLGALDAARRFLGAFEPLTQQAGRETGPLAAALAEGFHQLGEDDDAGALIDRALARVAADGTVHVDRYEAGAAVVSALSHWPHAVRAAHCERLFLTLTRFTDTFTTQYWYPTHQLLMAERLIECLVDEVTVRSDRLQAFLDKDEARVRKRILSDWRALAG